MRTGWILIMIACLLALAGCGGGGNSGGQTQTTPVKFDISWGDRSRAVNAPGSALSAVLTLKGARADHGNFTFSTDRKDDPAAYTLTYTSTNLAVTGTWNATVTFYANKGGQGQVVGVASKSVTIKSDGTGIGDIATVGSVASVQVVPGQTVATGQSVDLLFTALDSAGNLVALTPGSAKWNANGPGNILQLSVSGTAIGLLPGTQQVTVTVDGKTSAPADVTVTNSSSASLIAEATSTAGAPSVRLRWASGLFSGLTVQQIKVYRLPDFPFGAVGTGGLNGGGINTGGNGLGGAPTAIPIGTVTPTGLEFTDLPTPNFFYKSGAGFLTGQTSGGLNNGGIGGGGGGNGSGTSGSTDCVLAIPTGLATLDVGFQPGLSVRYQITAVGASTVSGSGGICIETDPVQSGLVTPIAPVLLTSPANQSGSIDLHAFAPTFASRNGADVFQVEVSTDPTFKNPARIYRTLTFSTAPNADGVSQSLPQPVDLTVQPELLADPIFATFVSHVTGAVAPSVYWRVGARHDEDSPGPIHWISGNAADPDRTFRFVYATAFSFIPK